MTTLEGLNSDFRDLLILLVDNGTEFVVVGAYAVAFHGAPRASGDIDLFVRPSPANAERVYHALTRFGAPLASAGVASADFAHPGTVYQIGLPPRRIDILTQISGVTFDEAWASRTTAEVEGRPVGFIGREALLKNKEATGRPKDAADISRLRRTDPAR
jgi:Nucleotidyl transferase of unknown function (DUF2204)